ncbi:MAG TPA: hypothetical protein VGI75_06595, partial [Pirellulales bacterium]
KGDMQCGYTVTVPKSIEIDRVSVSDQTGDKSCSWVRGQEGKVSIVPDAPLDGVGRLLIVGRKKLSNDGSFIVPAMPIEHCSSAAFSLLIARSRDALVKISGIAGMAPAPEGEVEEAIADAESLGLIVNPRNENEMPLEVLGNARDFRPVQLHIESNDPQVQVAQLTTMSRQAAAWSATINASLSIERGVADTLRFDLPANWVGPFSISPAMDSSVEEVAGENRRQLVLRPEVPLSGRVELQIRGPLTLTQGQTPTAPDARLVGAASQLLYVLLPRQQESKQLSWDVRRLIPTRQLPEALLDLKPDLETHWLFQILGERSRASLRSAQRANDKARVRTEDIAVSWSRADECAGTATFDLESASETSCEVVMPERSQLISASVDGVPAQLTRLGERRFNIWLGDNQFPRRVEAVFTTEVNRSNNRVRLLAPFLAGLPAEHTLWRILGPSAAGDGKLSMGTTVSDAEMAIVRLEQTATLADSVVGLLADEPINDVERWYLGWRERFKADRAQVEGAARTASVKDQELNLKGRVEDTDKIEKRLELRLHGDNSSEQGVSSMNALAAEPRALNGVSLIEATKTLGIIRGEGSEISISYAAMPATDRSGLIAGISIGVMTAGIVWLGRRRKRS